VKTGKKKNRKKLPPRAKQFAEKYQRLGEVLGEGSIGRVESFLNVDSRKKVAVKVQQHFIIH